MEDNSGLSEPQYYHKGARKEKRETGQSASMIGREKIGPVTVGFEDAAPQDKMIHRLVLVSFGTCHGFWNKLTTGTEVPLYFI